MSLHRIILMLAWIPASVFAQATVSTDPLDALVKDSPFAPVTGAARSPDGNAGPIEFRSVVFENGEFVFSLYDQASQQAAWVKLGQTDLPFVVRSYDQERDVLTVEHQGRQLTLELQAGRMTDQHQAGSGPPLPVPGPPGSVPPLPTAIQVQGNGPQPNDPTNVKPRPPGLSEQESQRLQALADEIRRRRQSPLRNGIK